MYIYMYDVTIIWYTHTQEYNAIKCYVGEGVGDYSTSTRHSDTLVYTP